MGVAAGAAGGGVGVQVGVDPDQAGGAAQGAADALPGGGGEGMIAPQHQRAVGPGDDLGTPAGESRQNGGQVVLRRQCQGLPLGPQAVGPQPCDETGPARRGRIGKMGMGTAEKTADCDALHRRVQGDRFRMGRLLQAGGSLPA